MTKRKANGQPGGGGATTAPPTKKIRPDILPALPPISPDLEKLVFTHQSATAGRTGDITHYDRLEFIGDAQLGAIAADLIFDAWPNASAGRMSQMREQLIRNETLAQFSIAYGFDKRLRITIPPDHQAKFPFTKVYGDVFEAYIGAIFRSNPTNGPSQTRAWLQSLWAPLWAQLHDETPPDLTGVKEKLASLVVAPGVRLEYVAERDVKIHKGKGIETHYIGVYLTGWGYTNQRLGSGHATSKTRAGQEAAMHALNNHPLIDQLAEQKKQYLDARQKAKEEKEAEESGRPKT